MQDNQHKSRYELEVDGHITYADYRIDNEVLSIKYVFAPPELRGTGAAGKLMQQIMEEIKGRGFKVVPICGYASAWINRHKEYHNLLA